jgi:hypothetical protein
MPKGRDLQSAMALTSPQEWGMRSLEHLPEKMLRRLRMPSHTEHIVDRVALGIHLSVEVVSLVVDLTDPRIKI